jgi:hypothetical protein
MPPPASQPPPATMPPPRVGSDAQQPSTSSDTIRRGFYASASLGPGLLFAGTDSSTDARTFEGTTLAVSIAMGGRIGDHVAIGGTYLRDQVLSMSVEDEVIDGDEPNLDDIGFSFDRFGFFIELHPMTEDGLHFQGFLGFGDLNTHRPNGDEADDPSGVVFALAGGYEWLLSEKFRLGGLLRLSYASLSVDETGVNGANVEAFLPTLVVTATHY